MPPYYQVFTTRRSPCHLPPATCHLPPATCHLHPTRTTQDLREPVLFGLILDVRILKKPLERVERSQAIQQFWQRLEQLGQALDLKILRLHLAGYKLEEMKQELGGKPSVSTIWKRKKRLMTRIKEDEVMREIAQELGILPAE